MSRQFLIEGSLFSVSATSKKEKKALLCELVFMNKYDPSRGADFWLLSVKSSQEHVVSQIQAGYSYKILFFVGNLLCQMERKHLFM